MIKQGTKVRVNCPDNKLWHNQIGFVSGQTDEDCYLIVDLSWNNIEVLEKDMQVIEQKREPKALLYPSQ